MTHTIVTKLNPHIVPHDVIAICKQWITVQQSRRKRYDQLPELNQPTNGSLIQTDREKKRI